MCPLGHYTIAQRGSVGYINLTITAHRDERTNEYVVRCQELGISTMAENESQILPMITDAIALYLNTLEEVGERDRLFEEIGLTILDDEPRESTVSARVRPGDFVSPLAMPVPA